MRLALALTCVWCTCACPPTTGTVRIEVFEQDVHGPPVLRERDLDVLDLHAGRTTHVSIVDGSSLVPEPFFDAVPTEAEWHAAHEAMRGSAAPVSLRLAFVDGAWRGEDLDSVTGLSLLATMDDVVRAAAAFPGVPQDAVRDVRVALHPPWWRRTVVDVVERCRNNAAFSGVGDLFLSCRGKGREPLAGVQAVNAHELGHRVQFVALFDVTREADRGAWVEGEPEPGQAQLRRERMYLGLNEGFSDVFALAITGRSPSAKRDVEGAFARDVTLAGLRAGDVELLHETCGGPVGVDVLSSNEHSLYCIGVLLVRTLWDAGGGSMEGLHDLLADVLPGALPAMRARGAEIHDDALDVMLDGLADSASEPVREALCAAYRARMGDELVDDQVAACSR